MSPAHSLCRVPSRTLAALVALTAIACSARPDHGPGDLGVARIALTQVPADAQCLDVVAQGARVLSKRFSLVPGGSVTLEMAGLPLGDAQFSGTAYPENCGSSMSVEPSWVSDPVPVTILNGEIAQVALVMHRNGRATIGIDFVDDAAGGADGSAGAGGRGGGGGTPADARTDAAGDAGCGTSPSTGDIGQGCSLSLSGLSVSRGVLSPTFDPDVLSYRLRVPVATQTVTLTPSAADGVSIEIGGQALQSGEGFSTPVLNLGIQTFTLTLRQNGREQRTYMIEIGRGTEVDYLKASNTDRGDAFGYSVAISGDTIVIGAIGEGSAAKGLNDATIGQSDNSASNSGAAYVFVRSGGTWNQQAYLKASNAEAFDQFGNSVAISGDTIVVGASEHAHSSGAAYVFVRGGESWTEQAYLRASNPDGSESSGYDAFGFDVGISDDTIVVGAPGEASAARGVNDTTIGQADNSARDSGAAYVFRRSGNGWSQQAYLKASNTDSSDYFGMRVAISHDTIVVGAQREGSAAKGVNDTTIGQANNSATASGAAYVFVRNGESWTQQAYLKASNTDVWDNFGSSVAISDDTIVVGAAGEDSAATGVNPAVSQGDNSATGSGAAYVFVRHDGNWSQQAYLKASNTRFDNLFGIGVGISGDAIVVGAYLEDSAARGVNDTTIGQGDNSAAASGAAYLFIRSGTSWTQQAYLKASNTDPGDRFGQGVAISDGTIVVGTWFEASAAIGVNDTTIGQADNSATGSGAAYIF
jgi:hypothetical protein